MLSVITLFPTSPLLTTYGCNIQDLVVLHTSAIWCCALPDSTDAIEKGLKLGQLSNVHVYGGWKVDWYRPNQQGDYTDNILNDPSTTKSAALVSLVVRSYASLRYVHVPNPTLCYFQSVTHTSCMRRLLIGEGSNTEVSPPLSVSISVSLSSPYSLNARSTSLLDV